MPAPRSPQPRVRLPRRPALIGLLLAVAWWLLVPGVAFAHAHLVQADPAPDSVIARVPSVASFIFDEPLNPALTRVRITTASGRQVTATSGYLAPGHDGELWQLPLPVLPAGTYSVFWTSESATDGHIMSSFYTFRVAPSGGANSLGTVMGAAAGAGTGAGADIFLSISNGAGATALFAWLGQMAQALWLGALVIELAVLAPARRAAQTPEAQLARAATQRVWILGCGALVAVIASLVSEVESFAMQGTGGDWSRALAPATLAGIFSSQNGQIMLARLVVLLIALLAVGQVRIPAIAVRAWWNQPTLSASYALGIVAPRLAAPNWESTRWFTALLASGYMLLVAISGHAVNVTPVWLSCGVDWLHLLCTAAWLGGIAALAFGVVPLRRVLPVEKRALALLPLLDRFSPVAYVAVGSLALSGLYIASSHLHGPSMVAGTVYGHLLMLKMALVGVLIILSASHVQGLRPRIARAQQWSEWHVGSLATVHEGLAALAGRLRLEAGIGAGVLLVTALMGQTLPATAPSPSMASMAMSPAPAGGRQATPGAITGTAVTGDLRGQLTIAPATVGAVMVTLHLWERGQLLTANTAAAIIHLFPAMQPNMRAALTPEAEGTRFMAHGSLAMTGTWRAEVLVRTAMVNDYRALSFAFTAGSGAHFLVPTAT